MRHRFDPCLSHSRQVAQRRRQLTVNQPHRKHRWFESNPADLTVLYIQHTPVAQWTERTATNRGVKSSNLFGSAKKRWQSGRLHRIANPEISKDPEVRILHASFLFFAAVAQRWSRGLENRQPERVCRFESCLQRCYRLKGRFFAVLFKIIHIKNKIFNILDISSICLRKTKKSQIFSV